MNHAGWDGLTQTAQTSAEACGAKILCISVRFCVQWFWQKYWIGDPKMRAKITIFQTPVFQLFISLLYRRIKRINLYSHAEAQSFAKRLRCSATSACNNLHTELKVAVRTCEGKAIHGTHRTHTAWVIVSRRRRRHPQKHAKQSFCVFLCVLCAMILTEGQKG